VPPGAPAQPGGSAPRYGAAQMQHVQAWYKTDADPVEAMAKFRKVAGDYAKANG
jgi:hypothetical protein